MSAPRPIPEASGTLDPRVRRMKDGDAAALEELLHQLLPSVRRWLFRLLGPRPDLDDAVQDTLVALATALPRFEGRSRIDTFARRITLRVAYRYFGRRHEAPLQLVPPPPDELDPESRAMDREALRRLYRCLDKLPEKRRAAFVLCAIEGLEPSEAAEVAGVTAVAMRSRLKHARREVERLLQRDPYVQALVGRDR